MSIFHRHKWRYIATDIDARAFGPRTLVLMRCPCGMRRVGELRGHWTLEQLLATQPKGSK